MEELKITELFDLTQTIAADYLSGFEYPWQALAGIGDEIVRIGNGLSDEEYEKRGADVWVARSAKVAPTAFLGGPCIIGPNTEVRHCAFVRSNAIVGENCVIGNSVELKNVIIFNKSQVPHYNYVGDAILGFHAHMGAGSITSNVKADNSDVTIACNGEKVPTDRRKVGAFLGDNTEIGCNSVLNPGTVIGRGSHVYPMSMVRGYVPANHIFKNKDEIVEIK